jgi:hypothetical protein
MTAKKPANSDYGLSYDAISQGAKRSIQSVIYSSNFVILKEDENSAVKVRRDRKTGLVTHVYLKRPTICRIIMFSEDPSSHSRRIITASVKAPEMDGILESAPQSYAVAFNEKFFTSAVSEHDNDFDGGVRQAIIIKKSSLRHLALIEGTDLPTNEMRVIYDEKICLFTYGEFGFCISSVRAANASFLRTFAKYDDPIKAEKMRSAISAEALPEDFKI